MRLFNTLVAVSSLALVSGPSPSSSNTRQPGAHPNASPGTGLILQKSEGERRVRRPPPSNVVFIFPDPRMVEYFREASVPEGDRAVPFSAEEFSAFRARHRAHIVFEER